MSSRYSVRRRPFELISTVPLYLQPAMKVLVIIPAAGLGTRMAASAAGKKKASKQFTDLGGTPILVHTLRKFVNCPQVDEVYVALRRNEIPGFRARLESEAKDVLQKTIHYIVGGEHRQQSVANALAMVSAAPEDIVLVHDAVRPFVSEEIIRDVIEAARRHGAAIAGMPAVDTVKQVERTSDGAVIKSTIPREKVVMAQTPQGFHYKILRKIFDEATADGFMGTDEASLAERSGQQVAVVMGSSRNIKITTPADLQVAEFYLKSAS
jgi:2-C-methyl-D-erythritol 4-phosphate cytidylyltransferase